MSLGATAPLPIRLLQVRHVPTGHCGWTGHVELTEYMTMRKIFKHILKAAHDEYLPHFSLTLVRDLREVIVNHHQQTGGSRADRPKPGSSAQDPVTGEAFLTSSTTASFSSCLLHVKPTFYIGV